MVLNRRFLIRSCVGLLLLLVVGVIGASFYMIRYSLAPEEGRTNTDSCYRHLYTSFPETKAWTDSLRAVGAIRDTFLVMPTGERHHALYIPAGNRRTAIVLHGWRDCAVDFLFLARMYEKEFHYNVLLPDLHAHGLSEGGAIGMGWNDKDDVLCWLKAFATDTVVVHGVSMGAATAMMLSALPMPEAIHDIRFVEDCGYTNVWDEFAWQMKEEFGLPAFPLMYTSSLLCKVRYGWRFGEASALEAVGASPYPMLFIHGDSDRVVPTEMVYKLYHAKHGKKKLWIAKHTGHAEAYANYKEEYTKRVRAFID